MDTEKIVSTILEKVGKTDVSKETATTLVGLYAPAEGTEPDDAYFNKMVKAVKSVQGNVNNVFSEKLEGQVKTKVKEELEKHKQDPKPKDNDPKSDDDVLVQLKKLNDDLAKERQERQQEKIERQKKNLLNSVKEGLKAKFDKANLSLNNYFVGAALSKLQIPEEDADVDSLVENTEKLYNAEIKAAGIETDVPHNGGKSGSVREKVDEHEFDDIIKLRNPHRRMANNE